jgi:RNA binding exosome subunit
MSEYNHVVDKDGNVDPSKVDRAISSIDSGEKDRILRDFDEFKGYLGKRIKLAESIGLGEEQMAVIAQRVADYLASHEDPRNSEEKLLQELWKVGTEEERHKLAHMLVRLAQTELKH